MSKHSAALMVACMSLLTGRIPLPETRRRVEFERGTLRMSDAVKAVVHAQGSTIDELLARHVSGDFGKVDADQRGRNNCNIRFQNGLVISRYVLPNAVVVVVTTDLAPEMTTLTLGRE